MARMTTVFFLAVALIHFLVAAPVPGAGGEEATPLWRARDAAEIDAYLGAIHRRYPTFLAALEAIVRSRVGTPYSLGCLGEEKAPDDGPLFRVDVTDCTVFVLTSSALAHSSTTAEAREWMKRLNYYPGADGADPVSYGNRIHFTWDRLHSSPYFRDITSAAAGDAALERTTLTLNEKANGGSLLNIPWKKKVTALWLPSRTVGKALLRRLPAICGVAFVSRRNFALGVVVSHEGFLLDRSSLFHASSVAKRVEERDFMQYLEKDAKKSFDGVIFYELR